MRSLTRRTLLNSLGASAGLLAQTNGPQPRFDKELDVIVAGGTTAGVGAAIAAGRQGMRVAVIEETPVLGGMIANGLCNTDGSPAACTGVFEEFRHRSLAYYQQNFPRDPVVSSHPKGKLDLHYEPSVADRLFREMAAEIPSVTVYYRRHVAAVLKRANRVIGVVTRDLDDGSHSCLGPTLRSMPPMKAICCRWPARNFAWDASRAHPKSRTPERST